MLIYNHTLSCSVSINQKTYYHSMWHSVPNLKVYWHVMNVSYHKMNSIHQHVRQCAKPGAKSGVLNLLPYDTVCQVSSIYWHVTQCAKSQSELNPLACDTVCQIIRCIQSVGMWHSVPNHRCTQYIGKWEDSVPNHQMYSKYWHVTHCAKSQGVLNLLAWDTEFQITRCTQYFGM